MPAAAYIGRWREIVVNPVAEMFKWMAIGFAVCGAVALIAILIGWVIQRVAGTAKPGPANCPCGRKASCLLADSLGLCNETGKVRFVRKGQLSNRPSIWWLASVALFLVAVGCLVAGRGPIHSITFSPLFPVALGSFIWSCVIRLFRKNRDA